jgi:hypothetical protein
VTDAEDALVDDTVRALLLDAVNDAVPALVLEAVTVTDEVVAWLEAVETAIDEELEDATTGEPASLADRLTS